MSEIQNKVESNENEMRNEMEAALEYSDYHKDDIVKGIVVQVTEDDVLVDIKWKSEGVIPRNELSSYKIDHPNEVVKEGDLIEAVVIKVDHNEGKVLLSRKKAVAAKAWEEIERSYESGSVISGRIREVVKGGVLVDLGARGFIPASLLDIGYIENLDSYLGQTVEAKIIELDRTKGKIVLSRKILLEEARSKIKGETWSNLEKGQIKKGIVRRLTNFGAFVDIGGIDGLLHVSEMAWHHVKNPADIVQVNDEIEVQILDIDKVKEKVSLGLKQTIKNPWENVNEKYPAGALVSGKVIRIAPFGAFVELEPGIDGLVHLSQLSEKRIAKVEEVVSLGQEITVKILEVKEPEKRISLSLKDVASDAEVDNVQEYLDNQESNGTGVSFGDVFSGIFDKEGK